MRLFACALVVCGCSATGVPIVEPEHVTSLATAVPQSELEAIAWSLGDVIVAATSDWLSAPPGAVEANLASGGTMSIDGTLSQPADQAHSLRLTIAYDGYQPKISAAVPFTDWRISSTTAASATIDFTEEPLATKQIGFINGTFAGTVELARVAQSDLVDEVEARLVLDGQLMRSATGKTFLYGLWVTGVIRSSDGGAYYNQATVAGQKP